MTSITRLFRSLFLATLLSFSAAFLFVGGIWGMFAGVSVIPGFEQVGHITLHSIESFLGTFGSGSSLEGMIVIGGTFSFVVGLFDVYTFYRCENLRHY